MGRQEPRIESQTDTGHKQNATHSIEKGGPRKGKGFSGNLLARVLKADPHLTAELEGKRKEGIETNSARGDPQKDKNLSQAIICWIINIRFFMIMQFEMFN